MVKHIVTFRLEGTAEERKAVAESFKNHQALMILAQQRLLELLVDEEDPCA